jgi:hypothetical protein
MMSTLYRPTQCMFPHLSDAVMDPRLTLHFFRGKRSLVRPAARPFPA